MPTLQALGTATQTITVPGDFVRVTASNPGDAMRVTWTGPGGNNGQIDVKNTPTTGQEVGPFVDGTVVTFLALSGSPSYDGAFINQLPPLVSGAGIPTVATLGDSLQQNGLIITGSSVAHTARNVFEAAAARLRGRMRIVKNAGISGQTSLQMAARFDTDVTPFAPSIVFMNSMSNDIGANKTFEEITGAISTCYEKSRAIGAKFVYLGSPKGGFSTEAQHNTFAKVLNWAAEQARTKPGFYCWLWMVPVLSYATTNGAIYANTPKAGCFYDSTHLSALGAHTIAKPFADWLDKLLPPEIVSPALGSMLPKLGDASNMVHNSFFANDAGGGVAGTGNTGTVAGPYAGSRSGAITCAFSLEARTDNRPGSWQRCDLSGATAAADYVDFGKPIQSTFDITTMVGKTFAGGIDFKASAGSGTIGQMEYALIVRNSAATIIYTSTWNQIVGTEYLGITEFEGRAEVPRFVMPVGAYDAEIRVRMATSIGGAATIRFAAPTFTQID